MRGDFDEDEDEDDPPYQWIHEGKVMPLPLSLAQINKALQVCRRYRQQTGDPYHSRATEDFIQAAKDMTTGYEAVLRELAVIKRRR